MNRKRKILFFISAALAALVCFAYLRRNSLRIQYHKTAIILELGYGQRPAAVRWGNFARSKGFEWSWGDGDSAEQHKEALVQLGYLHNRTFAFEPALSNVEHRSIGKAVSFSKDFVEWSVSQDNRALYVTARSNDLKMIERRIQDFEKQRATTQAPSKL